MDDTTLFVIPDISGFTQFVTQTEIQHGQHIIQELLEVLIDSNEIGLTLGEIEGDAILFYKQDQLPDKNALAKQAQTMFTRFHQHLKNYQGHRICECGACRGAGELSLKIIVHAGPSNFISVKGQKKPYGQDIILVHRLLKNNVASSEYLLLSDPYMQADTTELSKEAFPWLKLQRGSIDYTSFGTVNYCYGSLTPLHELITEPVATPALKSAKPIIVEILIERSRDFVFEIIIDLKQRMKWNKFANSIDFDANELNKVGTKHVCVFDTQTLEFESVTAHFGENSVVYGEKMLNPPAVIKDITLYFIVSPADQFTRVQLQVHYLLKPVLGWLLGPIFRAKNFRINKQVLQHLKSYCESISDHQTTKENQQNYHRTNIS